MLQLASDWIEALVATSVIPLLSCGGSCGAAGCSGRTTGSLPRERRTGSWRDFRSTADRASNAIHRPTDEAGAPHRLARLGTSLAPPWPAIWPASQRRSAETGSRTAVSMRTVRLSPRWTMRSTAAREPEKGSTAAWMRGQELRAGGRRHLSNLLGGVGMAPLCGQRYTGLKPLIMMDQ